MCYIETRVRDLGSGSVRLPPTTQPSAGFSCFWPISAGPTIFRPTPSFGWAFVFLGKFGWSGPARLHCVANVNDFRSRDTSSPVRDFIRFDLRKAGVPRPEGRSTAVTQLGGLQMPRSTRQG